ncbi:unnamed protein product [Rotaria sp. Silwood2]|nr:unnamed protein product [Rotaria sp. Silwood2]CAF4290196.1 unnamed protein product [Rotaria sp. Silwood2]
MILTNSRNLINTCLSTQIPSPSVNSQHAHAHGSASFGVGPFRFGGDGGGSQQSHSQHSESSHNTVDTTKVNNKDLNHLNVTRIEGKNDTKYLISRSTLQRYLADNFDNVYLEGDLVRPKPIDVHLIKQNLSSNVNISKNAQWSQHGITIAGGNGPGFWLNQLNNPQDLFVDMNQTVYIADYWNHRIMEWKWNWMSGRIVAGGNGPGGRNDQLDRLTDVVLDRNNESLIICDAGNRRVVRWSLGESRITETIINNADCYGLALDDKGLLYTAGPTEGAVRRWRMGDAQGTIVAGGNGQGNGLHQLKEPLYMFVARDRSVYVSDHGKSRVMKWTEGAAQGIVVAGGNGQGDGLIQVTRPHGLIVDQFDTLYVEDFSYHRVMKWPK